MVNHFMTSYWIDLHWCSPISCIHQTRYILHRKQTLSICTTTHYYTLGSSKTSIEVSTWNFYLWFPICTQSIFHPRSLLRCRLGWVHWWLTKYQWLFYLLWQQYCVLVYKLKKHSTIDRSSIAAEFRILEDAIAELIWVQNMLHEIDFICWKNLCIWIDNLGAKYLAHNLVFHSKIKHMPINFKFYENWSRKNNWLFNIFQSKNSWQMDLQSLYPHQDIWKLGTN